MTLNILLVKVKQKLHKIDRNLRIISQTEEKYFSITVQVKDTNIYFEFKDSLEFLSKSIDKSFKYYRKTSINSRGELIFRSSYKPGN
jgi:hypothetical protein